MQRAYSLKPQEQQQAYQLEEQQKNLMARYGAITLERAAIRKQIPLLEEQQRTLLRSLLAAHNVSEFQAARIEGGNLMVQMPDEPPAAPVPIPADLIAERSVSRPNGK